MMLRSAGDVAAHHPERLAQRALDDGDAAGDAVALGNAAAARAVHADRVDLVEIGERFIFVGEVADFGDRRDVAVHRIDALEGDQLGRVGGSAAASNSSRWARSLWRKTCFSQPELRMPAIIEA